MLDSDNQIIKSPQDNTEDNKDESAIKLPETIKPLTAEERAMLAVPLEKTEQELVAKIIDAPTKDDLQYQFDLFNINQSKKNALRIIKLNNLLSKVEDQALERFEKRPDQVSNKELLDYMTAVSGQIDRAQKQVDTLSAAPTIHVTNQKNEVNINVGPKLDRESKERVIDAVSNFLSQIKKQKNNESENNIIDAEASEIIPDSEEKVYNKEESLDNQSEDVEIVDEEVVMDYSQNKLLNDEEDEE